MKLEDQIAFKELKDKTINSLVGKSEQETKEILHNFFTVENIWKSACEYKQKEIDDIKLGEIKVDRLLVELASNYCKLQAENEKLRESLDKCKRLILLADKSVCKFEMNEISLIQWNEFIKDFPEEALKQ